MEWDIRNDQPIYTQLIQQVTLAILSGTFLRRTAAAGAGDGGGGRGQPQHHAAGAGGAGAHGAGLHPAHCRALCYRRTPLSSTAPNRSWPTSRSEPFCTAWSAWLRLGADRPAGAVLGGGRIRDGYFRM